MNFRTFLRAGVAFCAGLTMVVAGPLAPAQATGTVAAAPDISVSNVKADRGLAGR